MDLIKRRTNLVRRNGTLIGLSLSSNPRGLLLHINLPATTEHPKVNTCLSLANTDFAVVYERAVDLLCQHFDIDFHSDLRDKLSQTGEAFLRNYGLKLELVEISYEQVVAA